MAMSEGVAWVVVGAAIVVGAGACAALLLLLQPAAVSAVGAWFDVLEGAPAHEVQGLLEAFGGCPAGPIREEFGPLVPVGGDRVEEAVAVRVVPW